MGEKEQTLSLLKNCLFLKIFQNFRMAAQPSKLLIALLALAVIFLTGRMMDLAGNVLVVKDSQGIVTSSELDIYLADPQSLDSFIESLKEKSADATVAQTGVFYTLWNFASLKFHMVLDSLLALDFPAVVSGISEYFSAVIWAVKYHTFYCIIFFLIALAVIAFAGGAICRIAALQFTQGEKPGLFEALRFSKKNFWNFFLAPLAPLVIIVCIGLFIFALGLLANFPRIGELTMPLFVPLALLAGTLIAIISIGTVAGFNLMFPAIACEGSDFFDAISRSFNYVFSKPWHMAFYTTIAAIYGAICYFFVRLFAFLLLWTTWGFLQFGIWTKNTADEANKLNAVWPQPEFMNLLGTNTAANLNWSESITAFLVHLEVFMVLCLVVSFVISFYFSANTVIYTLMRKHVDNTALEKVYTHLEEAENKLPEADSPCADAEKETPSQDNP